MVATFELNAELLNPVIRKHFDSDSALPLDFEITALKPGLGNPTSLGVYRVSGNATVHGVSQAFSVVVKHLASGAPQMDTSSVEHWNHWRREILFFESPLVSSIPKGLSYPQYLGHSVLQDGTELFWNSDLGDLTNAEWTWPKCLEAAQLVAELNCITSQLAEPYKWLNRTQWQGWLELRDEYFLPYEQMVRDCALDNAETALAYQNWGDFLDQAPQLTQIMWDARQCFVHGDFNLNNLVPHPGLGSGLTALDWQLAGVSGLGSEIASIFNTAVELDVIRGNVVEFDEICQTYVERFNQLNPNQPVALDQVRLVAAATGYVIINGVGFFFLRTSPDSPAEPAAVKNLVRQFSTGVIMAYSTVLHQLL